MALRLKSSFQPGLTLRFIALAMPVFLLCNAIFVLTYQEYRQARLNEEVAAEAAASVVRLSQAVAPAVGSGDVGVLSAIVRAMAGNRTVACVRVVRDPDMVAIEWPNPSCLNATPEDRRMVLPIRSSPVSGWRLEAAFSTNWAETALRKEMIYLLGATGLAGLAAFVASIIAHRWLIGRPIDRIRAAINHRARTGERRAVEDWGSGAMSEVIQAYNLMLKAEEHNARHRAVAEQEVIRSREAEAVARAENKAHSQFLATISHEIRTPMNGVMGLTEMLLETPLSEPQREHARAIQNSADSLLRLIADILDYAQLESRATSLVIAPFNPREAVAGALEPLKAMAKKKNLALSFDSGASVPEFVSGDADRIRQIVANLANNAIKFTPSGRVGVRLDCQSPPHSAIVIEVRDTGIGMPVDQVDRLFERFAQAETDHARRFQGVGLGLAICRELVTLMGGLIEVESKEDEGSLFRVVIPAPIVDPHQSTAAKDAETPAKLLGGAPKILLVEDSPTNQMVVSGMLSTQSVEVVVVADGFAAINALHNEDFDLVLMDIQMPGMSGLEAARAIRSLPDRKGRVPILALTANVFVEDELACRDAGMQGLVPKPVRKAVLLDAIAAGIAANQTLDVI